MDPHRPAREDNDGLWDWNLVSGQIHWSPRWISLVGCEEHEIGNTPAEWLQRIHPDDAGDVVRQLDAVRDGGPDEFSFRHRLRHKDGTYRWTACHGVAVRNDKGQAIRLRGSHSDITVSTVIDPLTGLPNHLLLHDRLNHSIERAHRYPGFRFALLLIDVGRPPGSAASGLVAGDPLLSMAARRLETCLRIGDTGATIRNNDLVARVHDDRFAVLLDGLKDVSHAKVVADRLLSELLAPVTINGRDVLLTVSIGVAVSVTGYQQADDVLRDAASAAHRARVLGGSHAELFDTASLRSEQAELKLEADFSPALDRGEFELFYQPVVSVSSTQLVGFEALVRWKHPVLGLVAPQDFIPLAEKSGFIVPLGQWILREACLRLREWQQNVPLAGELWMSVNLSSIQLKHPALIDHVGDALRESGINPRCLVLELTEGTAMENPTAARTLLMQLRSNGVRISIDDFGTGYSSLAYLRQFPVDTLKVDRSFVRGMETHKASADIVGNLTAMAQQLGVQVVAEGIENEAQFALLKTLRCQSAQGYLFAKPLDVTAATEFIRTGIGPQNDRVRQKQRGQRDAKAPSTRFALPALSGLRNRGAAAAAAAGVLLYAGVAGRIIPGALPLPTHPPSPALPVAAAIRPVPPRDGGTAIGRPAAREARTDASRLVALTPPIPVPSITLSVPSRTKGVEALASLPLARARATSAETSLNVAHQHRIGSCKGRLIVSATGIAFVPDDDSNKDGFAFAFSDFLQTVEGDTFTIKSASRTYRFKAAGASGDETADPASLRRLADSIANFR